MQLFLLGTFIYILISYGYPIVDSVLSAYLVLEANKGCLNPTLK